MIRPPPPPITIDMRPDGTFSAPPKPPRIPFSVKLGLGAVLVATIALGITVAALALWVVATILPILVIAAAVAYATHRYRRWKAPG